jgi:hypothetical protein
MRWLDRLLCAMSGHDFRWPYRDGDLMRTQCWKCGKLSRGVVVR